MLQHFLGAIMAEVFYDLAIDVVTYDPENIRFFLFGLLSFGVTVLYFVYLKM